MATHTYTAAAAGTSNSWNDNDDWDAVKPAAGGDVVFDGRVASAETQDLDTDLAANIVDLASFTITPNCDINIGDATTPLKLGCTGTVLIQGTGDVYLQCAGATVDTNETIATIIIDTPGTVGLSSFANDVTNVAKFTNIIFLRGTLILFGDADSVSSADSGTAFGTLFMYPTSQLASNATLTIGDQCEDFAAPSTGTVWQREGTSAIFTDLTLLEMGGGVCRIGGTAGSPAYDMDADDDNITTINQRAGTIAWNPTNSGTSPDTASESPAITTLNVYGGNFDASNMLATTTTAPTITVINQYNGTTVSLNNGNANIVVGTYNKFGGVLKSDPGQSITLT